MPESSLYLYAVVDRNSLEQMEDPGLFLVQYDDLACVARSVSRAEYCDWSSGSASDQVEWLASHTMQHHQVLLGLMRSATVVPLKFGTLCSTVADAKELLRDHQQQFLELVRLVHSREEWSLCIDADRNTAIRHLELSEPELARIEEKAALRPEGEAYLLRKKKQKLANQLLASRFSSLEEELYVRLQHSIAHIAEIEKSRSPGVESREILLNLAILIPKDGLAAMERELAAIESDYSQGGITATLCGPWPPYSFANVDLTAKSTAPQPSLTERQ